MGMSRRWRPRGVISSQVSRASIILRFWTAFLVIRKGGGSGTLARKSAIGVLGGARSLVCKQSERREVRNISGVVNWAMLECIVLEYNLYTWPA